MEKMRLTRLEAARRQLDQAIRLFFQRSDPVSIHTLTTASLEILRTLAKRKGLKTWGQEWMSCVRPERRKEFWEKLREAQGFFKHADQGPLDLEIEFSPKTTEFLIYEAVEAYPKLAGTQFSAGAAFWVWFFIKYQALATDEVRARATHATEGLDHNEFSDFIELIARIDHDPSIMQQAWAKQAPTEKTD
ncbi:MAG: hypothetical protein HY924_00230 [Elusimicrobia bacterium]|nr:hypothetical protein [Elusimicrobiota bacterium]